MNLMPRKLDFSVMVCVILINTGMAFWILGFPSLVFRIIEVPIHCLGNCLLLGQKWAP